MGRYYPLEVGEGEGEYAPILHIRLVDTIEGTGDDGKLVKRNSNTACAYGEPSL